VRLAASASGGRVVESGSDVETEATFLYRMAGLGVRRVRVLGGASAGFQAAANATDIHLATEPVTNNGFLEGGHFLREQAVSRTLHRFGNLFR